MKRTALSCCAALVVSACASTDAVEAPRPGEIAALPGANTAVIAADQASRTYASQQAQLREIRNAEARVTLARTRLDLATVRNKGASDGDVREYLNARQSLRNLRSVYGPTDTGYRDQLYIPFFPYESEWPRRDRRKDSGPIGIAGKTNPSAAQAKPLSGLIP